MASPSPPKSRTRRAAAASAGTYAESNDSSSGPDVLTPYTSPAKSKSKGKDRPKPKPKATPKPKRRKLSSPTPDADADSDVQIIDDPFRGSLSPLTPLPSQTPRGRPTTDPSSSPRTASPSPPPPPTRQRALARPAFGGATSVGSGIVASLRTLSPARGPGRFVWARIDGSGALATDDTDPRGLWWPAEMHDAGARLTLFGDSPGARASDSPSALLLQSLLDVWDQPRYSTTTFCTAPAPAVRTRWSAALAAATDAGALPSTALLSPGVTPPKSAQASARPSSASPSPTKKTKRKRPPAPTPTPALDDPGPDPLLSVPGELVLARWDGGRTHWPARITGYAARGRYTLEYCDGQTRAQERGRFVCETDDAFARVPLGQLASDMDAQEAEADVSASPFATRGGGDGGDESGPLPPPVLPPPAPFADLPMRTQLAYVAPVLRALVRDDGARSPLHAAFFGGARARADALRATHLSGELRAQDARALERVLRAWVFGAPRLSADDAPDDPELPTGPEYATLSAADKINYFSAVLVPEATFQLLLWRRGERTLPGVQDADEEARLRARGEALSSETDWVRELLRRRAEVCKRDAVQKGGVGKGEEKGRRARRRG